MAKTLRPVPFALLVCTVLVLSVAPPAHAYVDPGTGSYLIQFLIAVVVGLSYTVRLYWDKIMRFFAGKNDKH